MDRKSGTEQRVRRLSEVMETVMSHQESLEAFRNQMTSSAHFSDDFGSNVSQVTKPSPRSDEFQHSLSAAGLQLNPSQPHPPLQPGSFASNTGIPPKPGVVRQTKRLPPLCVVAAAPPEVPDNSASKDSRADDSSPQPAAAGRIRFDSEPHAHDQSPQPAAASDSPRPGSNLGSSGEAFPAQDYHEGSHSRGAETAGAGRRALPGLEAAVPVGATDMAEVQGGEHPEGAALVPAKGCREIPHFTCPL